MEDAVYEIESARRSAGVGSTTDELPDQTTVLNFRHLQEDHTLSESLLEVIN